MTSFITGFREAWGLARPFFLSSSHRWTELGLLGSVIGLNLILTALNVENTYWQKYFYDSLQHRNFDAFLKLIFTYEWVPAFPYFIPGFAGYVTIAIIVSVYSVYLNQMLQIRWRQWMTRDFSERWLADRAYYNISLAPNGTEGIDNPDQRISMDLADFTTNSLSLALDLLVNVVNLFSFVTVLYATSGSIRLFGILIPGYMLWLALIYAIIGTIITHLIGRKLINLNFRQQKVEADFRYSLIRVRDNPEAIALLGGEGDELSTLRERFAHVRENWWAIMRRTKLLGFFFYGFTNLSANFALFAGAPRYFSGAIQLGDLMQLSAVFGNVQSPLSWIVGQYTNLVALRATIARLHGFQQAVAIARTASALGPVSEKAGDELGIRNLTLKLPQGKTLLDNASLNLKPGAPIYITGASGVGKSTLLRAIAGIWPHGEGTVSCPEGRVLFLPQRPYFPLGTLKRAITYPDAPDATPDDKIVEALQAVELADLAPRLHDSETWGQVLSGGEQQRLSLARAVIAQPDWLFLDEALSALDDPLAEAMQAMLAARLPKTTVVAITHRDRLGAKHRHISLAGGALTEHPRLAAE